MYSSLSRAGFRHAQIEQAMSSVVQQGGDLIDALDWLCLNLANGKHNHVVYPSSDKHDHVLSAAAVNRNTCCLAQIPLCLHSITLCLPDQLPENFSEALMSEELKKRPKFEKQEEKPRFVPADVENTTKLEKKQTETRVSRSS